MSEESTEKTLPGAEKPVARLKKTNFLGRSERFSTWMGSIWRQRWLSLICAWTICVAGWLAVALWPNNYQSSAVVYADLHRLAELDEASGDGETSKALSDEGPVSLLKAVLLTEESLAEVRQETGLLGQPAGNLLEDISIRATAPTLFVTSYDHHDPAIAHQVLDSLFSNMTSRLKKTEPADAGTELKQEIAVIEGKLQNAEATLSGFQRSNEGLLEGVSDQPADIAALEDEIVDLRERIERAIVDRDEVAQELAQLPLTQETPSEPEPAVTEPLSDSQRSELAALETSLAELRKRYADSHPYVSTVLNAIDALNAQGGPADQASPAETDPSAAAANVNDLSEQITNLKKQHEKKIADLSALNNELANKQREIDRLKALTETTSSVEAEQSKLETERNDLQASLTILVDRRDALQKRQDEKTDQQDGGAEQTSFRLINEPNLPDKPTGLSRLLGLVLVLFGGVGIGGILAILRNRSKGVFESAWQLKQRFDVGVLGTISEVLSPAERKQLGYAKVAFSLGCLGLMGIFSGLAIAEFLNLLTPWGDSLRTQLLG